MEGDSPPSPRTNRRDGTRRAGHQTAGRGKFDARFMKLILMLMGVCGLLAASSRGADTGGKAAPPAPAGSNPSGQEQTASSPDVIPLIRIEDAPITDAIKTLALQAGLNIQMDPRTLAVPAGPDGKPGPIPTISFRWENLTAAQALEAVLEGAHLQMVENPRTKVAMISPKDDKAVEPLFTSVILLKYANPTNLVTLVKPMLSARSQILPDMRTSKVVLVATENELARINDFIGQLDVAPHQILIEARFLETSTDPKSVKGIDWSGTLAAQHLSFGNGLTAVNSVTTSPGTPTTSTVTTPSGRTISSTTTPADSTIASATTVLQPITQGAGAGGISMNTMKGFSPATAFLNADGLNAVLSFLNTDTDTESIANPRAVTLDGTPTELAVVRNIPVFEQQQGANTGGSVQANTVKPNYALVAGNTGPQSTPLNEVGIKLIVTPRVVGETNVFMDLKPEISSQEAVPARVTLGGQISESPIFARRKLSTQTIIPSGNTLVLGGLINDNTTKSSTKVPILGDLPLIGLAFRQDSKERSKQNLMIFVTPTVVEATDYAPTSAGHDFLKSHGVLSEDPNIEPGAWENGKPYDWTKPK